MVRYVKTENLGDTNFMNIIAIISIALIITGLIGLYVLVRSFNNPSAEELRASRKRLAERDEHDEEILRSRKETTL